jgi:hypothetical protein
MLRAGPSALASAAAPDRIARKLKVVRHQHAGEGIFAVQRLQQFKDALGGWAVEVAGRLVGQQQLRLGDQCPGNR